MFAPFLKKAREVRELLDVCQNFKGTFDERETNELRLWTLTFEEIESLGISVDPEFVKDGMLWDYKKLDAKLFYVWCQVYDASKTDTHLRCRYNTVLESLAHLGYYWK